MGKCWKRIAAFVLCLLMLVSVMPEAAYASTGTSTSVETTKKVYTGTSTIVTKNKDADDADDDEVVLVSTKTTYKISITVWTRPASSSDNTLKFLKISRPKLTKTVVKTYSDGSKKTSKTTKTYALTVKVSVAGDGWSKVSLNDTGTSYRFMADSGKRIQAVKITPSGSLSKVLKNAGLSLYYRATSENFGKLGWAKSGWTAGTTGNSCDLTAFQLKILSTEDAAQLDTSDHYISKTSVTYTTKITGADSYGSTVSNGSTSGSKKSSTSIGALKISLATNVNRLSGSIKYKIRTSTSDDSDNWTDYVSNGTKAGSTNSKIKAIKIKLTGDMADYYDVYYRVYVSGYGWLGWAKNGEKAGTKESNYNISAIQVKLVTKGSSAPGTTSKHYIKISSTSTAKATMISKAQSFTSSTKYLILVDRANCKVGIFTGSQYNWTLKYYWSCCVGKSSSPTITGSYTVGIKGYSFGESKGYSCYYYTQISGNYLFHSVLYYPNTRTIKDGTMGKAVSHGCVRLTIEHAKWIYDNIPTNTKVYIW